MSSISKEENGNMIINSSHNLENALKIQQEKKTYLNLYFCRISYGIIYTYMFIGASMAINIVNRVIFLQYKFKFNFTLILLHQIFCICFFMTLSITSTSFTKMAGKISFNDFLK